MVSVRSPAGQEAVLSTPRRILVSLVRARRAVASVEYAVIAGIIAIAITSAFTNLGGKLLNVLSNLPI